MNVEPKLHLMQLTSDLGTVGEQRKEDDELDALLFATGGRLNLVADRVRNLITELTRAQW